VNRVEHVGSFVRPEKLLNAVRERKAGRIDDAELKAVQDEAIRDIVAFQESIGLPSITDGEFRRRSWSAGFIDAIDGFGLRDGTLSFRDETRVIGVAASPYAKAPLKRKKRIVADDYRFLKSVVKRGVPKVTMAAPDVMHYFLGPKAFDAYKDREAFFADLVKIYRQEIRDLAADGGQVLFVGTKKQARDAVMLSQLRRIRRGFVPNVFGFLVPVFFVHHLINLVRACAVKSTMGTTRA